MSSILVTGGTGAIGTEVVRALAERRVAVRALARDPARAVARLGDGAEIVRGDFADRTSIERALDGVQRVFLCCPNHPRQADYEAAVIDAAAAAGVDRIVKISANGASVGSLLEFWDVQGRLERHLQESGVPAVVLEPSLYMSLLLASAEAIRFTGKLFAPAGDAKITMIDPRDVAAVAVVALTTDGHEGRSYVLTGPEAVTFGHVARELSAVAGRPVEYVDISDQAALDGMLRSGMPEWVAERLVVLFGLLRRGVMSTPTDVVRVLTGREPRSVADFVRDHAVAFQP